MKGKAARDPLLTALIWRLPPGGQPWPLAERVAWLKMAVIAFDVTYGADEPIAVSAGASAAIVPQPDKHLPVAPLPATAQNFGHDIYIDKDGYARRDPGAVRVLPSQVPMDEPVYDMRGTARDRDTIIWADDSTGAGPGMSFCGPG